MLRQDKCQRNHNEQEVNTKPLCFDSKGCEEKLGLPQFLQVKQRKTYLGSVERKKSSVLEEL